MIGAKLNTKGIQGMQAVSNLPISAWLPTASGGFWRAAAGSQALIGIFRPRCDLNMQFSELYS